MIKRLFSQQSHTITGAAILLGAASLASRLIGLVRDRLFAHYFGAGDVLDAYYAAFRIPDFLFNLLLVGAITVGFVPIFLELWHKEKQAAWEMTNKLISLTFVIIGIGSALAYFFAPTIMHYITPGFTGEKLALTIKLTRIMLLSPILLGVSGVISGVLHALRQFVVFAFAPLLYNLAIIFGTVVFVPWWGPVGLAWGVVLGGLLHVLIQIPTLIANGFRFSWQFGWADTAVRKVLALVVPRTFGMATVQINFVILDSFASSLAAGSIAVFYLAHNLYYVPIGLIGHAFSLAAFPVFANYVAEKKFDELVAHFARVVRQILFLVIPMMILLVILRAQIVRVALGSGKFSWSNTSLTADTLGVLAISLAAHCIMLVTARALFALKDVWTTFWISAFGVAVTTVAGLWWREWWGIQGLALALSVSMMVQCALLWLLLRRRVGGLGEKEILWALGKISLAGVALAFVAQKLKLPIAAVVDMTRLWGILSQGAICGIVGLFAYGLVCHWLRLEEMELFKASLKRRWLRILNVQEKIE